MNDKIFKIILGVLALVAIGAIFIGSSGGEQANTEATSHLYGNTDASVTLVEYGDFQCPACFQYYPILKQVKEKYKDVMTFQFRNFPLVQIHQNAMSAHRGAEAAANQGKFWEMHDLLYERQQSWSQALSPTAVVESYAEELGLNIDQFKADLASEEVSLRISADIDVGQSLGATGTPTFVLNGEKIETPAPTVEAFSELIESKLLEAQ